MFSDYKVINTPHTMNPTVMPTYNLPTIYQTNTMAANLPTSYQVTTKIPNQIIPQGSNAFMYGYYNPLMLHPQVTISSGRTLNSSLINPSHHYVENKNLGGYIHHEPYTSKSKQPVCKGTPLQKTFPTHHYQTLSPINTLSVHLNPTSQPYVVVNNTEELPTDSKHLYSTAMFKRFIHNILTNPKGNHYKAAFDMNNAEELPADAMLKRFTHNVLTNPKGDLNAKNPNYYYQLCFL